MASIASTGTVTVSPAIKDLVLAVDAGTGSVDVQLEVGAGNWITVENITADARRFYEMRDNAMRFTANGDAQFSVYGVN